MDSRVTVLSEQLLTRLVFIGIVYHVALFLQLHLRIVTLVGVEGVLEQSILECVLFLLSLQSRFLCFHRSFFGSVKEEIFEALGYVDQ
mmetsp:Transcript_7057/g.8142  ORF Transcript_7057/g.8142 Transcript_7057/m.8142 type:complete len:88 (+) Transcript_7057:39-302(+)